VTASTPVSTPKQPAPQRTSESIDAMTAVLDDLRSVTDSAGRGDLSARLSATRQRITDSRLRIAVTGESKKGISSLVNSLVCADICATDADFSAPVIIEHGESLSRSVVRNSRTRRPERTEATVPAGLLAEGVVLIDTPGITGADSRRAATTLSLMSTVDAVLFVSDASQELTEPEIRFLEQLRQLCPTVACVINKIDGYVQWADIQKANRKHLNNAKLGFPILPVSSAMHQAAHRLDDRELEVESGIPQLLEYIRGHLIARADTLARDSVINDVRVVSDHLALSLDTELDVLRDPARGAELLDRIQRAREAADNLRKQTANWQYVLGDGVTELSVAVEHDLRNRLRTLVRGTEEEIAKSHAVRQWEAFGNQLDGRIADAVSENFLLAHTLSLELAAKVAGKFAEEGRLTLPELHIDDASALAEQFGTLETLDNSKTGVAQRLISSLRGSYGGVLMVGLATSLMGLALVNPFSIGAGLLLGANTFREDHKTQKTRRQAEAKLAVARLMDEVIFQVNKESKQRLREVQRTLRDHFADLAEEMFRSVNDSLQSALQANNTHESQRNTRVDQIQADLGQLRQLRLRAADLAE